MYYITEILTASYTPYPETSPMKDHLQGGTMGDVSLYSGGMYPAELNALCNRDNSRRIIGPSVALSLSIRACRPSLKIINVRSVFKKGPKLEVHCLPWNNSFLALFGKFKFRYNKQRERHSVTHLSCPR